MPTTAEGGEMAAPSLPLLSDKQGRIVDFARIYRRSTDDEAFESLQDLAEELESVSTLFKEREKQAAANGTGAPRYAYAPDQLQLLTTTRDGGNLDTATSKAMMGKRGERTEQNKGKPMRRFLPTSSNPPFVSAGSARQQRRVNDDAFPDELYLKVQQVRWEDDIQWGIDFKREKKEETAFVEETEDGEVRSSSSVGNSSSVNSQRRPSTGASSQTKTGTSSGKQAAVPRTYKEMYPRHKMSTVDTPWVPSATKDDFDMSKPRHYRWELEDDKTTKSGSAQKKTDTNTTGAARQLPCPINRDLDDGSWVGAIGWKSTKDMPDSKLILDDNDVSLIFTNPEMEDVRPTLRIPERKLGATELKARELQQKEAEKGIRTGTVITKLGIPSEGATTNLVNGGGTTSKTKDSRIIQGVGSVHHSLPAIKLSMTKPELPKTKLREFHRPRSKFKINERMMFAQPPVVPIPVTEESAVVTQIKKSSDLNPIAGGKLILVEYTEQNPPMLSNPGMASRILHYWRPPEQKDDSVLGKKAKKTRPKPPEMEMGQVITLGDHDDSPFVGDVPPGRMVTSLNSKLFKVPIFRHKPLAPFAPTPGSRQSGNHELFLLCRAVSKGKKGSIGSDGAKTKLYVFELPDLYLAGQVEPQMEVPAPNSKTANRFISPYMSFHILRLFKKASDGERLKMEDIARAFPNQSSTAIRKRMQEVATFERGGSDSGWWKKKPSSLLPSEEDIRANIPPESVCLYESMMSGHRRLLDIGLTKLFTPTGVNGVINVLIKRLESRKQALSASMIEPLGLTSVAKEKAEKELWKTDSTIRKLETDIQVARYILEQLQLTPWNLTNNYVECHLQGKGSGMLQLGGIGDPTGRGEGFSFVRVPQSRAKKKDGEEEGAAGVNGAEAVQKAVAAVTGTTADLRKLTMKETGNVLRNLGVPEADIKNLRRWDRIHVIRQLSTMATAIGRGGALSKFARGARKSLSAQQQEYRRKCDVIYERQMDVLGDSRGEFSSEEDDDVEDDMDLDELEEAVLGAGAFTGGSREKMAKLGPRNLFAKGGGGLNRSAEALAEREDADELERFMAEMKESSGSASAGRRPDIDSNKLRNQLRASGISEGSAQSSQGTLPGSVAAASRAGSNVPSAMATPTEHRSRASSPTSAMRSISGNTPSGRIRGKKVLKRTVRVVEEDGTERVRIEFVVDDKQVARFMAKQHRQERQLHADERNQLRKRKRMLALDDESSSQLDKAKKRKQLQEELKQLQKTEEQNKGYQEMLEKQGENSLTGTPQKGVIRCTQCGQPGHMRTNRSCPLYMADESRSKGDESSKVKVRKGSDQVEKITLNLAELREGARKHQAEKKRKRMQEVKEQAELYKRPYMNATVKQSRSRMPVSHLNSNLNLVVEKLLGMPESELFRTPVDAALVKDYYQVIKQPMDLGTIKKKTDETQYDSMRDFIKDLELMVNNSKVYNGDPTRSLITSNAVMLLKRAQEELATLNADGGMATPRG
ncbi:hypothetical protein Poli38472_008557 [Pythium oligandrum]|uniref:Bromo domain-containing protein n=1 Tax=Pythium oligandrum TaxID=41045 RepID=A0A8K1C3S9_PYTOL|nr:hypothetical protein Poli38472_008557 [Pythium oligandrum]|eukprot:TMW55909.1 hypothetical protein Poli38472_008557 [Pythium oligandrum]